MSQDPAPRPQSGEPPVLDYANTPPDAVLPQRTWHWLGPVLGILGLMFVVSLIIPSRGAPKERVQRVKCASNLKQIGQGLLLYAQDNAGRLPPRFDQLITDEYCNPEVFLCPNSTSDRAAAPTTQALIADLRKPGRCSYTYLGAGGTSNFPPSTILAYEEPANHDDEGMNVLYANGHVAWVSAPEAQRVIKELKAGFNPPRPGTRPASEPVGSAQPSRNE